MNNTVAKIFTGKLYFLIELMVSSSLYSLITFIFIFYTRDDCYYNAFYYSGIFLTLQIIWQLFQEKQEAANQEGEHYPLKISVFFFLTLFFGAIFLGIYFIFFYEVMTIRFKPIGPLDLVEVKAVDSKPDNYIRIEAFYDDYYSLKFSLGIYNEANQTLQNAVGCGCGVVFGPLLGTIGSPVSSVNYEKKKFDDIVLLPTMTCFCDDDANCQKTIGQESKTFFYRIHGEYQHAISNTKCPPETMDFVQVYTEPTVPASNIQIILLFTLTYIPLMFNFINFLLNYSKMGVIAFIKSHPIVRPKGISKMIFYFFLKWTALSLVCFFVVEEVLIDRTNIVLYALASFLAVPGVVIGLFFYICNPNFKFKQEFKNGIMQLKEYAESTHESVENFLDLCLVGLQLEFKYLNQALRELIVSLGFKGLAQSVFLFAFIAPEFLTEFMNESLFQQIPTNIRDNLLINSMILITGLFHGLFMGIALLAYQIVFDKTRLTGIVGVSLSFLFFIKSTLWFVRQWIYFKSFKKALASHIIWLYPSSEVMVNRSLVDMYFNRQESRDNL